MVTQAAPNPTGELLHRFPLKHQALGRALSPEVVNPRQCPGAPRAPSPKTVGRHWALCSSPLPSINPAPLCLSVVYHYC